MIRQSVAIPGPVAIVGALPAWAIVERLLADDLQLRLARFAPDKREPIEAALADLRRVAEAVSGSAERQRGVGTASSEATSWITCQEAAEMLGLSDRQWRTLATTGQVVARRAGRAWLLDEDEARDYRARTGAE